MAFWNTKSQNTLSTENFGLGGTSTKGNGTAEFYELEPAVVLDIILDKEHAFFKNPTNFPSTIDVDHWPADLKGEKPVAGDVDYSWVGRALVRMQYSMPAAKKEKLVWAYPLDSSISEYPLINEVVIVMRYRNKYFYSRKINTRNLPNEAVDFVVNKTISGQENSELFSNALYQGRLSQNSFSGAEGYRGVTGRYYKINNRVRRIKRHEGDTIIESRFGQSIRFGTYDEDRVNDKGDPKNVDYSDWGGNPMLILRNRQRKLLKKGETLKLVNSPNPATVIGTDEEKNAGGYLKEDINHDGSTIAITSGQTISKWVTTCYKKMFGTGEEVSAFEGTTNFTYPVLNGDQIIINSDRLVLSSRFGETFHYAKKRYGIVTDSEYTVDAHDQIVLTTHVKTVLNSPAIYLGEYDTTGEPVLLGQTSVDWLYELCNWMLEHTHWYMHSHVDAGKESPSQTQLSVQVEKLKQLRDSLHSLLSRRVFVVGGGYAPGSDGANI